MMIGPIDIVHLRDLRVFPLIQKIQPFQYQRRTQPVADDMMAVDQQIPAVRFIRPKRRPQKRRLSKVKRAQETAGRFLQRSGFQQRQVKRNPPGDTAAQPAPAFSGKKTGAHCFTQRTYTDEELDAMFCSDPEHLNDWG